jgi:hypothetical protein
VLPIMHAFMNCMIWRSSVVREKNYLRQSSQALQYGNIGVSCTHVYICTSDENCKMQQTYGGVALMD